MRAIKRRELGWTRARQWFVQAGVWTAAGLCGALTDPGVQAAEPATSSASAVTNAPVTVHVFPSGSAQDAAVQAALRDALQQSTLPTTLQEVDQWSTRLTADLRKGGFPLGQVLMTQQDWEARSKTGQLVFTAFPGRVSEIVIHNKSRVADDRLRSIVTHALCGSATLGEDCLFQTSRFERTTQLLQDLPGVALDGAPQFAPGTGTGTVRVEFPVTEKGKPVSVSASIDNNGIETTGRTRAGVSVSANNYFGLGEDYAFTIMGTDKRMWTGSVAGSIPIFSDGLRLTAGFTRQQYSVLASGTPLAGVANTVSAGFLYPFTRGLDRNVWGGLSLLHTNTSVEFSDYGVGTRSKLDSVQLSLTANNGDRAQQLRTNVWSAQSALTVGHQRNDDPSDSVTQRGGTYVKATGTGFGTYALDRAGNLFLSGRITGQLADRNLDSSEQLMLGGPTAVRAYRPDEPSADEGIVANVGLYRRFSVAAGHQIQPGVFVDYAIARMNHSPWTNWASSYPGVPNVKNRRNLAGYGVSVDWLTPYGATVSASVAKPFGFSDGSWVEPGRKPVQFWLGVTWNH
ncbi:ShlB/FhaC/HecB family hemolysin secretion/activation protein [Paraburkholderia adhaesiva]|uniref:ShlB/FhaC/HecB family hemolysin secretion/activation protein n=1 Tax=Paraburkholderia adhaesiva TaxID=2883244 RepID=UPI001F1DAF48|nr:ShlB/FhaC/HecB family hemolysin secretion/activation protein [Paraburkholderia adhaesiva]